MALAEASTRDDAATQDQLVQAHLGLARAVSRRFAHRGESPDDLFQVACLGLVGAAARFDTSRDVSFATFATATMVGELKRHFRDKGWSVRIPRRLQELHLEAKATASELAQELRRAATVIEVAERMGVSVDDVVECLAAGDCYRSVSLDPTPVEGAPVDEARLGVEDHDLASSDMRCTVGSMLQLLPDRDRGVVYLRFFEGRTQDEIGTELGLSQMSVSRILSRSLARLREVADDEDAPSSLS